MPNIRKLTSTVAEKIDRNESRTTTGIDPFVTLWNAGDKMNEIHGNLEMYDFNVVHEIMMMVLKDYGIRTILEAQISY